MPADTIATIPNQFRVLGYDYRWFLGLICHLLCIVGLISFWAFIPAIESRGNFYQPTVLLIKQILFMLIGACIVTGLVTIQTNWLNRRAGVLFALSLLLLILPLIPGMGISLFEKYRWVRVGQLYISSGPWAVLFATPFLLQLTSRVTNNGFKRRDILLVILAMTAPNYMLMIRQFDMPMAILLNLLVGLTFLLSSEDHAIFSKQRVLTAGIFMLPFMVMLCWVLISHPIAVPNSISGFFYQRDPSGSGYQTMLAINDIKAGGWFGNGLSAYSEPATSGQYFVFPYSQYRFIFQIIGRVFGYTGIIAVAGLYVIFFYICFQYIKTIEGKEKRNLALAMLLLIMIPTTLGFIRTFNLLPFMPSYDIPFLGYGRDSILRYSFALGVIMGNSGNGQKGLQRLSGDNGF